MTALTVGSPAASIAASTPGMPAIQHDAARQARLLRDALQSDKVRLGCFLGAGCPSGVYDQDGKKLDPPLIPDVARLTSDSGSLKSLSVVPARRWHALSAGDASAIMPNHSSKKKDTQKLARSIPDAIVPDASRAEERAARKESRRSRT